MTIASRDVVVPTTEDGAPPPGDDSEPPPPPALSEEQIAAFPPPRVARILASIDLDPTSGADVLSTNEIDEATFDALVARCEAEARRAASRGDGGPLESFDEAYVSRIEEDRGPLEAADLAHLVVAEERGEAAAACSTLEVPEAALVRLMRTLVRRWSRDREAAKVARAAIAKRRAT